MIFMNESVRKIPIQYSHKYNLNKKEEVPFLPIKINTAGVMPVIFASALITAPATIAAFFPDQE
jgi:preprotein translocase subunit SecY